ncbi:MAG: chromate transporter [Phycisphaerales bacterium]|nr:chromate transporter [Phycisphaerales bacterium]
MSCPTPIPTENALSQWSACRIGVRFFHFGLRAFGGPTAQIAMLHEELVVRDAWVDETRFRRALALYQALPGPEAHELCCWFGMLRGGRLGAIAAGLGFMLPGVVLMLLASWLYLQCRETTGVMQPMLVAVQAAIAGVILRAAWLIFRRMTRTRVTLCIAIIACLTMLVLQTSLVHATNEADAALRAAPSTVQLFRDGLWGGLTSFGGAYVAIPVLEATATGSAGWMEHTQFLDAIAIASVLPAPLVVFATFVGFMGGGVVGALAMTVGIFLPAFSFTLIGHHFFERIMQMPRLHALLDGIAAAAAGAVVATALLLAVAALRVRIGGHSEDFALTPLLLCMGAMLVASFYRRAWTSALIVAFAALVGAIPTFFS